MIIRFLALRYNAWVRWRMRVVLLYSHMKCRGVNKTLCRQISFFKYAKFGILPIKTYG